MTARRRVAAWTCLAVAVGLASPAAASPIEIVHGGRLTGRVLQTADPTVVRIATDLFAEPVEFVAAAVRREGAADAEPSRLPGLPGRVGLLTAGEVRLMGCLAACADGQVGWQPLGCTRPVAFAAWSSAVGADASGEDSAARIEYRGLDIVGGPGVRLARHGGSGGWEVVDVLAEGPAAHDGRLQIGDQVSTIAEGCGRRIVDLARVKADAVKLLLVGPVGSTVRLGVRREQGIEEIALVRDGRGRDDLAGAAAKDVLERALVVQQSLGGRMSDGPATVHLLTGESFACAVLGADEEVVRIDLGERGERSIPGDRVRALELSSAGMRPILKQKLARLLTVPRVQQASPPTHVVRMTGGDYLRGRLRGLDRQTVRLSVAGDVKSLPRRDVARIIRLTAADEPPLRLREALADRGGMPLVVVGADGRRQGIAAAGITDDALVGDSPTFGPTTIPLGDAARVLLGGAIDEAATAEPLPYAQWVLRSAPAAKVSATEHDP